MKTSLTGVALLLAACTSLNAASSTWTGASSVNWTNTASWLSGTLPGVGDDLIIQDSTVNNSLTLNDASHTVGLVQFGTTGTRTAVFAINGSTTTTASTILTITNGLTMSNYGAGTANGNLIIRPPVIVQGDQTWSVTGGVPNTTSDYGLVLTVGANGTQRPLTLNGTITKTGNGEVVFIGQNVGNGNIVVNQGWLKLNAGSSTLVTVGGTGSITVNNSATFMIAKNSGSLNITKAINLNNGATFRLGGNNGALNAVGSLITFNGNVPIIADFATLLLDFTNTWTGSVTSTITGNGGTITLWADDSTLSGSINNSGTFKMRFGATNSASAAVAWALNNAAAYYEIYGAATNIDLGSLSGASGILRNSNTNGQSATATVGALNTSTTFGGVISDNTAALGLIKVGSGTLTLTNANTHSGGTTVSGGTLALQGAGATGSGSVTVQSGTTLAGSGIAAAVSVQAGGTIEADGGAGSPPLNVTSLTLGAGLADATTGKINVYLGGKIANTGPLTVNGTHTVNILGAAPAVGVYDLITYTGGSIGGAGFAAIQLGTLPFGVVANLQDSGSAVQLNVTAVTIEPGIWVGNLLSQWNLNGLLEWKGATSGNPQPYHDLDIVTFDDSASSFAVNVTANVTPGGLTINNTTTYTFSGVGSIIGTAPLGKDGSGTLIIANNNSYSGGTLITNGTVQIGNGTTIGSIAGSVLDNGTLAFNRSDSNVFAGVISGSGSVQQLGSGMTVLSGANTYSNATTIAAGTLITGSGTALGDIASGTTVANGATLDENSQNLGAEPVTAQGGGVGAAGAIVNNGPGDQTSAFRYVTLTGPTTFGGRSRWDIRHPTPANDPNGGNGSGTGAFLIGNGNNLVKVGSNVVAFINVGDTALADIAIQTGILTFSRSTLMGDSSRTITVSPGATLRLHRTSEFINNVLNKVVAMTNAIFEIESNGLTNQFAGPISLGLSNTISLPTTAVGLDLQGNVTGDGSITTVGPGLLRVSGTANYSGGTTMGGGVLQVDGTLGTGAHPLLITGPTVVMGNGTILDPVTIPAGSSLSPGDSIGRLTINGALVLSAGSTNVFELNKDSATNDVAASTSVTYGGTLVLTNVGNTSLIPNDSFKLFAASSYSGGFSSIVPAIPGLGLIWVTNQLTVNGTISVAVLPNPVPLFALSASSLVGSNINVIFSAALDQGTAETTGNYQLAGNNISNARLVTPTNVLLTVDTPLAAGVAYTVNVKNVHDLAYVPNVVATTNVPGVAYGLLESFSVLVTNGSAFAYGTNATNQIKIYSDGADIFGTSDQFQYVYEYTTGDFDLSVRLESLFQTDPAAKAGLMVRDLGDPTFPLFDDRHYMAAAFTADSTRNNNYVQYREAQGATAIAPAAPRPGATYPNNWLRVKRSGSVLRGFAGPDGFSWTEMSAVDSATNAPGAYPATVRVGLAVTAHNAALTTEAIFSAFGQAHVRQDLSWTVSGGNLILSWNTSGPTLQATPSVAPPAIWTNVPGSTLTTTVTVPTGSGQLFYRLQQ